MDWGVAAAIIGGINAFGLVWLGLGWSRKQMTKGWTTTMGVVTDRDGNTGGGMPHYYPTFMWQDQHGAWHRRTSNVGASLQPAPGRSVQIKYDPNSPDRAVMDTLSQSGALFSVLGWFFIVGGNLIGGSVITMIFMVRNGTL